MKTVIELNAVSLVRDGKTLLGDINWRVDAGQHWALLGRNGSGKTLLLKLISGYLWPTKGSISVLGHKFGEYDLRELRKEIGWVSLELQYQFQNYTALDVVLSGEFSTIGIFQEPTKEEIQRALDELSLFNVSHLAERDFQKLSYGEQKRVIIARALVSNPKLLILDEPATGLDLKSREEFLESLILLTARPDLTVIYVTHHIEEIMPFISHALVLRNGECIANGSKESVLKQGPLNAAFDLNLLVEQQEGRYWARKV